MNDGRCTDKHIKSICTKKITEKQNEWSYNVKMYQILMNCQIKTCKKLKNYNILPKKLNNVWGVGLALIAEKNNRLSQWGPLMHLVRINMRQSQTFSQKCLMLGLWAYLLVGTHTLPSHKIDINTCTEVECLVKLATRPWLETYT